MIGLNHSTGGPTPSIYLTRSPPLPVLSLLGSLLVPCGSFLCPLAPKSDILKLISFLIMFLSQKGSQNDTKRRPKSSKIYPKREPRIQTLFACPFVSKKHVFLEFRVTKSVQNHGFYRCSCKVAFFTQFQFWSDF